MRRRVQCTPFMHAAETCCTQCAAARLRMAEGSSDAGSLHAANDNPAGDDGGSNETGNSEVVSLMDRLRTPTKSDLTRKRKIATNPPKGKRTCRGGATTERREEGEGGERKEEGRERREEGGVRWEEGVRKEEGGGRSE